VSSFKKTGAIWDKPKRQCSQIVRRVCEALERKYGKPRHGNPEDPLDDLIFIILSNKTSPKTARRIYEYIKNLYPNWDNALIESPENLRSAILPAGLATVKSIQIHSALNAIQNDLGCCDLNPLRGLPDEQLENYLTSLPGVSQKVAKCVMMYTFGSKVLPVDSHVHRISNRLGWTSRKRADQCHKELEELIPPKRRYALHVNCISHGRLICRPMKPNCESCLIIRNCDYFKFQVIDV